MAAASAVPGLAEELTCAVCLGLYSDPVSLRCGHSFCRGCVRVARRRPGPFGCPLCCAPDGPAGPDGEPQPNIQLRSIVERFLAAAGHERDAPCGEGRPEEGVPCDFCLREPQPAAKTCLSCEASLCAAHLARHRALSPRSCHVLTEPCDARLLAQRRCPQHGKLLECFCKNDSACLCALCCIAGLHKNHKVVALEEAFGHAQSILPETLKTVKAQEAALAQSIANLLKQEEEVKAKESLNRSRLESLFKEMHQQLDNRKGEVLKILSHSEEQQLSQIQMHVQKHKEEKDAASRDVQELEALREQKDLLLFTKAFAEIRARKRKPVPNTATVKLPTPPMIFDELTTDNTLRIFQQFLSDMQSMFKSPPVHEHLTSSVHQGGGAAHSNNVVFPFPLSSLIFGMSNAYSCIPHVQSNQSFSEGCHFWEVDTSKARCWKLGIIHSNFECYLQMSHDQFHVFLGQTMIRAKDFSTALEVVRVMLDCGRNTLSFYNASVKDRAPAESLRLIETVSIPSNYPVHATFGVSDGPLTLL